MDFQKGKKEIFSGSFQKILKNEIDFFEFFSKRPVFFSLFPFWTFFHGITTKNLFTLQQKQLFRNNKSLYYNGSFQKQTTMYVG